MGAPRAIGLRTQGERQLQAYKQGGSCQLLGVPRRIEEDIEAAIIEAR